MNYISIPSSTGLAVIVFVILATNNAKIKKFFIFRMIFDINLPLSRIFISLLILGIYTFFLSR